MSEIITFSDYVKLRPAQKPLFKAVFYDEVKNILRLAHRRFGKGVEAFMLQQCMAVFRRGIYGYFLPTIGQSRRVIWETIGEDGIPLLYRFPQSLVANIHHTDQVITYKNGSMLYVSGSDNYRRFIGMNFCYIVWDEFQDTNPEAVHAFRPMLTRNKGVQEFLGTPRAYNHVGEMYDEYKNNKDWFVTNLTIDDTCDEHGNPIITQEDIENERKNGMPEELIQQEYYGSFKAAIRGAYFSGEINLTHAENRIGLFPANPHYPVYTGWDLGFDDSMAIWVVQVYDEKVFLVDYFEDRGKGMEPYIKKLKEMTDKKGLRRAIDFAPHDIEVHELMPGKTRRAIAREMGINFRPVERPQRKIHGIQVIRYMFKRFHFNEPLVKQGLRNLSEYRPKFDEKNQTYSLDPLRNKAVHGADALQTFCLGWMHAFEKPALKKQIEIANLYGQLIW